ncbi:MAG TPA: hypothetical protein PLI09_05945 [Candidatus Hydrogenedentes bacterium]|nr:hypothetical protein [Candidatus Hydrogenedentota bacterium]
MNEFPRTMVGGISLSRMIIGSNWLLGYSHQSQAKDIFLKSYHDAKRIADVLEVFLRAGVDAAMGWLNVNPMFVTAIRDAQDRVGRPITIIDTPSIPMAEGNIDYEDAARVLDQSVADGATFFLPHQSTTDILVDRGKRVIRGMDRLSVMIRERGMIPGLSTHMPESVVYADESGVDVETYVQIYNSAGFLMQLEVEWVHKIIHSAKKPVMTIKPMAAGRLSPLVGFAFSWNTIRDQDMVIVGAMTPDEAKEDVELSLSMLERRAPGLTLQRTRSKAAVESSPR